MNAQTYNLLKTKLNWTLPDWLTNRRTAWVLALTLPLLTAPLWHITAGGLPGVTGTFTGLVLILLLVTCSITDLTRHKIYNWATYSAVLLAVCANASAGARPEIFGTIGLQQSLLGGAVCFVLMLVAYRLARGGAGDLKLAVAIGALLGMHDGVLAVACSYLVGGAYILAWTIWVRGPFTLIKALLRKLGSLVVPLWVDAPSKDEHALLDKPIPLAAFFAIGTCLVMLEVTI